MKKIMFNDKYGLTKAVLEGRKTMTRRTISPKVWEKYCEYKRGYQEAQQSLIGGLMDCDEYLISLATFKVGEVIYTRSQRHTGISTASLQTDILFKNHGSERQYLQAREAHKQESVLKNVR